MVTGVEHRVVFPPTVPYKEEQPKFALDGESPPVDSPVLRNISERAADSVVPDAPGRQETEEAGRATHGTSNTCKVC